MRKQISVAAWSLALVMVLIQSGFLIESGSTNESSTNLDKRLSRLGDEITVESVGKPSPRITLRSGRDLLTSYTASPTSEHLLEQNLARPTALASADFDEDGISDLIAAYAASSGGLLSLHRGNVDAIYPNSPAAKQRKADGSFVESPFLSPALVFELPEKPDFIVTGDFDADGHSDVVTAERASDRLYLMSGDSHGGFGPPAQFDLPGGVTALEGGDINRADGLTDVAITVMGADGARLLLFEGPEGALESKPEMFHLPAPATDIAVAYFGQDRFVDVAVAAGREMLLVEGRDRKLSLDHATQAEVAAAAILRQVFPFAITSISTGNFNGGRDNQLAALAEDGVLHLLSLPQVKSSKKWKSEPFAGGSWSGSARLISAKGSFGGTDDILVAEPGNSQLSVVNRDTHEPWVNQARGRQGRVITSFTTEGGWTAVLPMRLNADAQDDLVILPSSGVAPAIAITPATIFTVTTPADGGGGSLRAAIDLANVNPGPDVINFNILPPGPQTISLLTALPTITGPITIDGTTQPGSTGTPIIELNGSGLPPGTNGLLIVAGNSTVRGLVINRFPGTGDAIEFQTAGGNIVEGNFIGTDLAGTVALSNGGNGVFINGPPGNRVGGTTPAARNVISGNGRAGIAISGINSTANLIQGNFIGTDVTGTIKVANNLGVDLQLQATATIGGTVTGARNIISGNNTFGIGLGFSSGNLVQGNFIGTDVTGTANLGNMLIGVQATTASANNTFGGTAPGSRNIVSGNGSHGFQIRQAGTNGNLVQGNLIGTQIDGISGLGNNGFGVLIENLANNNNVGGVASGAGNTIVSNVSGVAVTGGTGNGILGNSIASNEILGIDLGAFGVTANDAADGDTGSNNLQNFPVLATANSGAAGTVITGSLNSTPSTMFRIEFFSNLSCDPSGNGEGEVFVGSINVTTDGAGDVPISATIPTVVPGGRSLTATATDPAGNTSEFSACISVAGSPTSADITVTKSASPDPVAPGANLTYSITVTNSGPDNGPDIAMTDNIPANTTFQSITPSLGWTCMTPPVGGTGTISCTSANLASPEMANFTFAVQVNPGTPGGTVITNSVNASSSAPDPNPGNNSASITTLVSGSSSCSLICPPNITASSSSSECGANVKYPLPVATGACGPISCSPPSLSFFPVGTSQVTCTDAGSGAGCTFEIRVVDNSPPLITCPTNVSQPLDPGQQTAVVNYPQPLVTENCPGRTTVCSPPSGAAFPLGATPVSCTARDARNNSASCSFTVTVTDSQPPAITCPANVVVTPQPGQCSPPVTYPPPSVSDNLPGSTVACTPPSGSAFPAGATTITCTATDAAGNRASCSFLVTVNGGPGQARISIPGGGSAVQFGIPNPIPARRKPIKLKKLPCSQFTIDNIGFAPLTLTFDGVARTGSDVASGRITTTDDTKIFTVKLVNSDQSQTTLIRGASLTIQPCQSRTLCVSFNPVIPAPAGQTSGLAAEEVVPDVIASTILFRQTGGGAVGVNLNARVAGEIVFINPSDPRKQPRLSFTRSGDEFIVESTVFDSNFDLRSATYALLDSSNRVIGEFEIDVTQVLQAANLVRGQSFAIEQRFSGAASHPEVTSVRVTLTDGQTTVTATVPLGTSTVAAASVSSSRLERVVLFLPGIRLEDAIP